MQSSRKQPPDQLFIYLYIVSLTCLPTDIHMKLNVCAVNWIAIIRNETWPAVCDWVKVTGMDA